MDGRDLRLIARLSREPLAPQSALAEEAGLSPNAARARIAKLRAHGVLMGVYAFPHPALFGKTTRLAVYAPPGRPLDASKTLEIDGVLSYSVNHDGQIAVTYYAQGPEAPPPRAVDALMGASAPRIYGRESPPMRPPGAALSRDQWRIVEAMCEDGRLGAREIAERTGLSERVVRRQRARMLEGNQVALVTGILSNLADGIVLFHLFVAGPGTKDAAKVERAIGAAIVQERTSGPDGLYIFCHADSLGDALIAREKAAAIPGVVHVELVLEREAGVATKRIQAMCRERREAFTAPRA